MRTLLNMMCFIAALLITIVATYAFAGDTVQACTLADGSTLYTNKPVQGCTVLKMPELSTVPDRHAILIPGVPLLESHTSTTPTVSRFAAGTPGVVLTETCALWHEYVKLTERTAGGFENNTIEDAKRRYVITRMFGAGFSPYGCQ
jgi:hypothetical protein